MSKKRKHKEQPPEEDALEAPSKSELKREMHEKQVESEKQLKRVEELELEKIRKADEAEAAAAKLNESPPSPPSGDKRMRLIVGDESSAANLEASLKRGDDALPHSPGTKKKMSLLTGGVDPQNVEDELANLKFSEGNMPMDIQSSSTNTNNFSNKKNL